MAKVLVGDRASEVEVLDMGCGTGLVGRNLNAHGFKNIVGIDAS